MGEFKLKTEWKALAGITAVFLVMFWLPIGGQRFDNAVMESLHLAKWYAREHVLLCLVPAFFIAGAIGVFISQASVMKYLGAKANKVLAYGVASVSGSILAVCSCTVLPLFTGIYKMGAGLGPATAFLYSGPAINVLAIILTARILGLPLGIARAVGAILFSVIIGLCMHFIFRKEEEAKAAAQMHMPEPEVKRPLWQTATHFAIMVLILVFANWGAPNNHKFAMKDGTTIQAAIVTSPEHGAADGKYTLKTADGKVVDVPVANVSKHSPVPGAWTSIWQNKWIITSVFGVVFGVILVLWFGIPIWKVVAVAVAPAVLALTLPMDGLMVMLPFAAAIVGLGVILAKQEGEPAEWFDSSWTFAKQIMPLLFYGVIVAGFLLGRVGHEGIIPSQYVQMLVGDKPDAFFAITGIGEVGFIRTLWPLWTNFFASIFGAFMYFATLTEVPILQGLIGAGMGKGPALALLLAGPALSLPNMLVIRSVMGTKKTVVFVSLVVVMATITGIAFGALA